MKRIILLVAFFLAITFHSANAQYWSVWQKTHNITLGLSSDEKWAFFIQKNETGVDNIYKVELKTNAVTPVTNFTERPVLSGIVLFGKPAVVYARDAGTGDLFGGAPRVHLYRINITTTDPPVDFTPKDGSSSKKILGMADNGRYVYYLSDRGPGSKTDTYRYDAAQYITELALANDKDYWTLAWSHDQTQLLLMDPKTQTLYKYSIESTDKQITDTNDIAFKGYKLSNKGNLSLNQKYIHYPIHREQGERVIELTTNNELPLPEGAYDLIIGPKEASVLFVNMEGKVNKLYFYDIAKKTSKELTTIK